MTFDRLVYIDRLKQAGLDVPLAPARAYALQDTM